MFDPKECLNKHAGDGPKVFYSDAYQAVKEAYQAGLLASVVHEKAMAQFYLRAKYKLTPSECTTLQLIASKGSPTTKELINVHLGKDMNSHLATVMVSNLNKKLDGDVIRNVRHHGYFLTAQGRSIWDEASLAVCKEAA